MAVVASGTPPALILGTAKFIQNRSDLQHPKVHHFFSSSVNGEYKS